MTRRQLRAVTNGGPAWGGVRVSTGQSMCSARPLEARAERAGSFAAALHQLRTPILLADLDRTLAWANPAAETLLQAGDGIGLHGRRLFAKEHADDAGLARAFVAAARGLGDVFVVQRIRNPSALIVRLSPLRTFQDEAGAQVLMEITESRARTLLDPADAARALRLTLAEARVACAICAGARTLAGVGEELRISVNTVKTLLHRVYDKTGIRSQAELTTMLASALRSSPSI